MANIGAMILRDIPPALVVEHAKSIQDGLDELWIVEDLPYAGGISQMTAVLAATDTVAVGHGIAPAPFRNPAALAMEWATLAEVFPGRVLGGIGHGVQSWMEQLGERVGSPLTLLAETIDVVQQLLSGATVDFEGRYVKANDVALKFPPQQPPLVSAGVVGPKSLRLSGAVAGGTIVSEGHGPAEIERALELINLGRSDAGHTHPHRLTVFAGFYCGDPSGLAPPNPDAVSGWDAVDPDPVKVAAKVQTLFDAGADSVVLVPFGSDPVAQLQLAAAEIVPNLSK